MRLFSQNLKTTYACQTLKSAFCYKYGIIVIILALPVLLFWFAGWDKQKNPVVALPPPVVVAAIQKKNVPLYLATLGTVTPLNSVQVKTQINGRLIKILFKEGQVVQPGQLLAQIDPQPYEAQLKQYEGQLVKDQALLANARLDLGRYTKLFRQDSLSRQMLDTQIYLVKQYEGAVQSDQGQIQSAQINLNYCSIISDIEGIVGLQQVNAGNYVQTTDVTPLTTINTITPITVVFPVPEDNLSFIQEQLAKKKFLVADAFDRNGETLVETGRLVAMDSQIDPTTGTVKLKALFENRNLKLFPNQFVNIRLNIDTLPDMCVIPTAAIQTGSHGKFVYLVDKPQNTISVKTLAPKTDLGEETAVMGDIMPGQWVVIQGLDKLVEGMTVVPVPDKQSAGHSVTGNFHAGNQPS